MAQTKSRRHKDQLRNSNMELTLFWRCGSTKRNFVERLPEITLSFRWHQ